MRRIALACLLGLAIAACGGKKTSASTDEDDAAVEEADEPSEEQKLRRGSNAVSPDSVKREVDRIQKQHENKVDESLDL